MDFNTSKDFIITSGWFSSYLKDPQLPSNNTETSIAQQLVRWLFSDAPFWRTIASSHLLKAIFIKKNEKLMRAVQNELQNMLYACFELLQYTSENTLGEIQIGAILAILPFLEPPVEIPLVIPQKIQNQWQLVSYRVEKIALTPPWLGSPMTAFGLQPETAAPSLLLFMGTPQPTATGWLLSVWTDFVPGLSVGQLVYRCFAKEKIASWVLSQQGTIKTYGKSLGGSLALLTAHDMPDKVSQVHGYNAAAPCFTKFPESVKVCLYIRENDPVQYLGYYPPHFELLRSITARKDTPFFAHIRSCPGFTPLVIIKLDTKHETKRLIRKCMHVLHFLVAIPIFIILTPILLLRALCIRIIGN